MFRFLGEGVATRYIHALKCGHWVGAVLGGLFRLGLLRFIEQQAKVQFISSIPGCGSPNNENMKIASAWCVRRLASRRVEVATTLISDLRRFASAGK